MSTQRLRVLLIEDDDIDARAALRALTASPAGFDPFDVERCRTLEEGRERLARGGIDAVLVDLGLPDASGGVTTVERLRKDDERTPIVVLTGSTDEQVALSALKAGAQDYVSKGEFVGSLLFRATLYAVERQRIELENARLQQHMMQISKQESLTTLAAEIGNDFERVVEVLAAKLDTAQSSPFASRVLAKELDTMRAAVGLASRLSDQLLVYAGQRQSWLAPLDLAAEVRRGESWIGDLLPDHLELELRIDDACPRILADADQVRRLLLSLVSNAEEACGDFEARVEIGVTSQCVAEVDSLGLAPGTKLGAGEVVTLSVRDTGPGVEESVVPRLFEPFYSSHEQGRGLGLAVVMGIAQLHGAGISVESKPGAGFGVEIHFPVLPTDYRAKGQWMPLAAE